MPRLPFVCVDWWKTRDIKKCLKMPTKMRRDIFVQWHFKVITCTPFLDPFLAEAQSSQHLLFSQGTQGLRQPTASVVPRLRSLGKNLCRSKLPSFWNTCCWLMAEILKHFSLIVCSTVYRAWFVLSVVHEWNSNNSISRSEGNKHSTMDWRLGMNKRKTVGDTHLTLSIPNFFLQDRSNWLLPRIHYL